MKDPTWGVEIEPELVSLFKQIPKQNLQDFLQRCKDKEYTKLDAADTEELRLKVKHRTEFVEELKKFFQNLLTMPPK